MSATRVVCANVSQEEVDAFLRRFPQRGAITWLVREAFKAVNRRVLDGPPDIASMIAQDIITTYTPDQEDHVEGSAGNPTPD